MPEAQRKGSPIQLRAHIVAKKLSNLTSKFNLRAARFKSDNGMPYGAHAMDMPRKPFMSQPSLAVVMNNDLESNSSRDGSGDESAPVSATSQRRFSMNPDSLLDRPNNVLIPATVSQEQPTPLSAVTNGPNSKAAQTRVRTASSQSINRKLPPLPNGAANKSAEGEYRPLTQAQLPTTNVTNGSSLPMTNSLPANFEGQSEREENVSAVPLSPRNLPSLRLATLPPSIRIMDSPDREQRVRLSPSIITRSRPLPIMHLPTMPVPSPRSATVPAPSRSRLMSMPVLPMEGPDNTRREGTSAGDTDDDDMDDMDMSDLEDAEDSQASGRMSMASEDEREESENRADILSTSSREFIRNYRPILPGIDMSTLDIGSILSGGKNVQAASVSPMGLSITSTATAGAKDIDITKHGKEASSSPLTPKPLQSGHDYFSSDPQPSNGSPGNSQRTPRVSVFSKLDTFKAAPEAGPSSSGLGTPNPMFSPPMPPLPSTRPGFLHKASRSMSNLLLTSPKDMLNMDPPSNKRDSRVLNSVDIKGKGKNPESRSYETNASVADKDKNVNKDDGNVVSPTIVSPESKEMPALTVTLRRQRSMPTYTVNGPPPPYPTFFPEQSRRQLISLPKEDEGTERLPCYSNNIYLTAIMPRKMEFSQPGVQAKDRKWRRVLCVLEGTVCRIYSCEPRSAGVGVLGKWWEKTVGVGDVSLAGGSFGGPTSGVAVDLVASSPRRTQDRSVKWDENENEFNAQSPVPVRSNSRTSNSSMPMRSKRNFASRLLRARNSVEISSPTAVTPTSNSRSSMSSSSRPTSNNFTSSSSMSRRSSMMSSDSMGVSSSATSESQSQMARHSSSCDGPTGTSHFRPQSTNLSSNGIENMTGMAEPDPKNLIREYTLQNAESGLASDYLKRKNVIRVRMEGEQFLLQAVDVAAVVEWIESLQAATNVSLDLDVRPMPRGPIFPRRRRRRRVRIENSQDGPQIRVENVDS